MAVITYEMKLDAVYPHRAGTKLFKKKKKKVLLTNHVTEVNHLSSSIREETISGLIVKKGKRYFALKLVKRIDEGC